MRRRGLWATLAAVAVTLLALGPTGWAEGVSKDKGFPEFEKCLQKSGLSGVPADQASQPVQICKTVRVTKLTVYSWALTKTAAPPALQLPTAAAGPLAYTLTATPTPAVTWLVDGDVVVRNVGSQPVTVRRVIDDLTLPDGSTQTDDVGTQSFVLSGLPAATPPEKVLHYSFAVPVEVAQATKTKPSNRATAEWEVGGGVDPTSIVSADVSFVEGPKTPKLVYFRTATLSDALDPAPPGVALGAPAPAGPFAVAADQATSLNAALTTQVTNVSLRCGSSATVTNLATLQSANLPERTNNATVLRPAPPPQTVSARALALVVSPECGPTPPLSTPQSSTPPAAIAGAPAPLPGVLPAGRPVVPAKPAKPRPCPVPNLSTSLVGPKRAFAGQRASWLVTVRNRGTATARRLVVQERLPVGFSVVGSTRAFSFAGRLLRFPVANLAGGRQLAIRITMHVDNGLAAGTAVHRVRVKASCAAAETAIAPVMVTAGIAPAVTG